MDLQMLSSVTQGLSSFGEAMSYRGAASGMDMNASLLDMQAKGVIASGDFTARRMTEQGSRFVSRQRMTYAKAGVTLEGSPLEVLMASERNISLDIMMTKLNAAGKANEIGFQALQQRMAAGQARTRAVQKMGEGLLKIGTSMAMNSGGGDMGGGGWSSKGNYYGSNTPSGVRDMGNYSSIKG
jgi:hypothetical protein